MMDKKVFVDSCYAQLLSIFKEAKNHQKDDKQKHRLEGYIQAGKVMGVISGDEALTLMEDAHYEIFGETIKSRKTRKASLKEAVSRGDDDFIDIPAYERSRQ